VCEREWARERECVCVRERVHLQKETFPWIRQTAPKVGKALVQHRVATQFIEALQLVFEKGFEVRLQHALVVESAQGFAVHADDWHVLVVDHVHCCLQRDLAVCTHSATAKDSETLRVGRRACICTCVCVYRHVYIRSHAHTSKT